LGSELSAQLLMICAICGEPSAGGLSPFVVRAYEGRAGFVAAHNDCLLSLMHPSVRALLDAAPIIAEDESPLPIDYIHAEHHGTRALTVSLYPSHTLNPDSPAVHEFFAEARRRLVPGMAMAGGPHKREIPPGVDVPAIPLVTLHFEPEHVPDPFWEIRDWLVAHPLARLIEIESHMPDVRAT
jgi:hypothetical protein